MILKLSTQFTRVWSFSTAGLTITIRLSKAGAAAANPSAGASNLTEISGGAYKFTLSTTDSNTLGSLAYIFTQAAILINPTDGPDQVVTNDLDTIATALALIPTTATPTIRQIKHALQPSFDSTVSKIKG